MTQTSLGSGGASHRLAERRCGGQCSAAVSGRGGAGASSGGADLSTRSSRQDGAHGDTGCGAGKQRTCGRAFCVWLAGLGAAACACAGRRVLLARIREKGLRGHCGESGLVCLMMVCWAACFLHLRSSQAPCLKVPAANKCLHSCELMSGVWRAQAGAVFGYLALHCVLGNRVSRPLPVA